MKPTYEDCIYAAGFFDGEGCVHIRGESNSFALSITVSQTSRPVLKWIQLRWGGNFRPRTGKPKNNNQRWRHKWTTGGWNALIFLQDIYPYLIVKQAEVKIGIQLQTSKRKDIIDAHGYTPTEISKFRALREEVLSQPGRGRKSLP